LFPKKTFDLREKNKNNGEKKEFPDLIKINEGHLSPRRRLPLRKKPLIPRKGHFLSRGTSREAKPLLTRRGRLLGKKYACLASREKKITPSVLSLSSPLESSAIILSFFGIGGESRVGLGADVPFIRCSQGQGGGGCFLIVEKGGKPLRPGTVGGKGTGRRPIVGLETRCKAQLNGRCERKGITSLPGRQRETKEK